MKGKPKEGTKRGGEAKDKEAEPNLRKPPTTGTVEEMTQVHTGPSVKVFPKVSAEPRRVRAKAKRRNSPMPSMSQ